MKKIYLIIGASAAGIAAAKKIRSLDKESEIICCTYEVENPYNKCLLVDWIAQEKTEEQVYLNSEDFFKEQRIEIKRAVRVTDINKEARFVVTDDGKTYHYTKLLLATGASPVHLKCEGSDAQGIVSFYTLNDAHSIKKMVQQDCVQNIIIIGGGISGIECADALATYGKKITILERGSSILGRHVPVECAMYIQEKASHFGVEVQCNTSVISITKKSDGSVASVECSNGVSFPADLVITALGSRAHIELAIGSDLVHEQGALVTNSYLQTSEPTIFAAGDCMRVTNFITDTKIRSALWPDAVLQGTIAGTNMVQLMREYQGLFPLTTSAFFGYQFVSCGSELVDQVMDFGYQVEIIKNDNLYSAIIFDDARVVKGFVLFGLHTEYSGLKRSLITKTPFQ